MQILGDTAADFYAGQLDGLDVQLVPLTFTLDGKTYKSGVDVDTEGFYRLISTTSSFPVTSQPSAGEFVEVYRRLAATDPDIFSIHVDSVLSGTLNAAMTAAQLVPEARITFYDSKTVSSPMAWQIEAAARAAKAGWDAPRITALLDKIAPATTLVFTVPRLNYLIHGGRVSHLKGMLARMLDIKPLIGIDNVSGGVYQAGQARTMRHALESMVSFIGRKHAPGSALRVQVLHGANPEAADALHKLLDAQFACSWLPTGAVAPILGAHTGPGVVAAFWGAKEAYQDVPGNPW